VTTDDCDVTSPYVYPPGNIVQDTSSAYLVPLELTPVRRNALCLFYVAISDLSCPSSPPISFQTMFIVTITTRMWANAQRDGRPAEHRWRPLYNAAVWLTPTTGVSCSSAAKTQNPLKLAAMPQTTGSISAASGPKFTVLCRHLEEILLLNKFFPIVDTCFGCEDIVRQSCAMVPRWRFLATILHPVFQRAACSTFQTCILNSH